MNQEYLDIAVRLGAAVLVGALIGLEREFRGRPAGFRTHTLVCLASALLMQVTVYQSQWMTEVVADTVRMDPTRLAQGIMTGIGFLGAGVIFKEGATVRGLTTAASIWITAAVGILLGVGFYYPAILGAVAILAVLAAFRLIEARVPTELYARHSLRFARADAPVEAEVRALVGRYGFAVSELSHRLTDGGRMFEYHMVLRTRDAAAADRLARHLRGAREVIEFEISPRGD